MVKTTHLKRSDMIRFDLNQSVEHNFNSYQDALSQHPESSYQLKLRYDQYLKTYPLHAKMQKVADGHDIAFDVPA